jgi:hypothetical protein
MAPTLCVRAGGSGAVVRIEGEIDACVIAALAPRAVTYPDE